MITFRIIAQHMFTSARIRKDIQALNRDDAIKSVGPELHDADCYVVSCEPV
jgi:hypothetical protein